MNISVDQDLCTGCGLCADLCPETFVMEGDKASAIEGCAINDEVGECCEDAASQCPVDAITVDCK